MNWGRVNWGPLIIGDEVTAIWPDIYIFIHQNGSQTKKNKKNKKNNKKIKK